jgi:hypothetical protein
MASFWERMGITQPKTLQPARAKSGDVIAKFRANQRPTDIAKSIV